MAADSIGVTPTDTGELLVGRVLVTPVLFESNGQVDTESQDWTNDEIQATLDRIAEGLAFWTRALDTLETVHTLEFVIDDTFAVDPVETPLEPIDRPSTDFPLYTSQFLVDQGFAEAGTIENATALFNHRQRIKHDADWSFTIFVADSSDDPDGFFAPSDNGFAGAFAFPGGLFTVTPSERPASTIAHETGHIFYARDEFAGAGSFVDRRGYYNAQNLNAFDNPEPGFVQQPSILASGPLLGQAFATGTSPTSTLAFVGWRDSDGDGIFDFADVPLELDGVGAFDNSASTYRFVGSASAVPLQNQNSAGNQSDITLNEVSVLEYRLDGGSWRTAQVIGVQQAELDIQFPIEQEFDLIELRVRDENIGVTSPIISGTSQVAGVSASSIAAVSFLDWNADGQRDIGEPTFSDLRVQVRQRDGSELFQASISAAGFDEGPLPEVSGLGITVSGRETSSGQPLSENIVVFISESTGELSFHAVDSEQGSLNDRFGTDRSLVAQLDQPVGNVEVTFSGIEGGSYARVQAFDAAGNPVGRVTSPRVDAGQTSVLSITAAEGNIHWIEVFGHAGTSIVVTAIHAGVSGQLTTDDAGVLRLANLPIGEYEVEITPELVIHDFGGPIAFSVDGGPGELALAAAQRVDSPRHNVALGADVDQNLLVTPLDALLVINDIVEFGSRPLSQAELGGPRVDVNNDGMVTPLDALSVINDLVTAQTTQGATGDNPDTGDLDTEIPEIDFASVSSSPESIAADRVFSLSAVNTGQTIHFDSELVDFAGDRVDRESIRWVATDTAERQEPSAFSHLVHPLEDSLADLAGDDARDVQLTDQAITTLAGPKIRTESAEPFVGDEL